MDPNEIDHLGEPDLQIAGLRIWIHGRAHPGATDYWDGNWLLATAYCVYPDAVVRVHGSIIHLGELVGLLRGIERLYSVLEGSAALNCLEPNLRVQLNAKTGGHIELEICITPDDLTESHRFIDGFDQTFLPPVIKACKSILENLPVREPQHLP
jgi:hypothetical protein